MSDFPVEPHFWHYPDELRARAQTLLQQGNAPASLGYRLSPEALEVLYKLASSNASASDGLKMLHKFQTHQSELDLQHEQSRINERETAAELACYKALYEYAPAGYFIISREGRILESNRAGADLLGIPCNDLNGTLFADLLAPASRSAFSWKLKKLFNGTARETCALHTTSNFSDSIDASKDNGASKDKVHALRMYATLAPDRETVLVNITELECPQAS
jgi:PAS domain-containing protein